MSVPSILRPYRLPLLPAAAALVCAWLALTPSLLPRAPLFQGLLCAVSALLGYGLGAALAWVLHAFGLRFGPRGLRRTRLGLGGVAVLGSAVMLWLGQGWQQEQRRGIGMDPAPAADPLIALVVAVLVFAVLLVLVRAVRGLCRWLGRVLARVLP
ncbi:MAG: hypothetical protein J0H64_02070, partial [Actinobacteria bacterium]|nr:hypothetical protein [Actinomycetota bacterium]